MDKTQILLVTPEGLDHKMITFRLENEGYNVISCKNKSDVDRAFILHKPKLIIFKNLAGLSVKDFINLLATSDIEKLPLILIETVSDSFLGVNEVQPRVNDRILSPVSPKELLGKIEELLHQKLSFQRMA